MKTNFVCIIYLSARDYLGKFINKFQPETKKLERKLERILN